MNFRVGSHPSQTFLSIQDAFRRQKSSPQDFSRESGSIPPPEIISPSHFYQIRMHSAAQNHPCKKKPANQDYFPTKMHPRPPANHLAAAFQQSLAFSAIDSFSSISRSSHTRLFPSHARSGAMSRSFATVVAISFMLTFSGFSSTLKSFLRL